MQRPLDAIPISHYENFPVASVLCPAALRMPIAAIYHFARTADDIADEGPASAQERLVQLGQYRDQLRLACTTQFVSAWDPRWETVFTALQAAVQRHHLPAAPMHDLLDAFTQDIEKTRDRSGYADDIALTDYCRRSANPVGRLLLHLYGVKDEDALLQSDAICTALQLINFWQDVSVDIPRGRLYFPITLQQLHGVDAADLLALRQTPAITAMLADCVCHARATMERGAPLVHQVPGRAGWELRLVVQGGMRILERIEQMHFATLRMRPTLHAWDYGVMLWRALWM